MWIWNVILNGLVILLKFVLLDRYFEKTRIAQTRYFRTGWLLTILAAFVTFLLMQATFDNWIALIAMGVDILITNVILMSYWLTRNQTHRQEGAITFYGRMLYLYTSVVLFCALSAGAIDDKVFSSYHYAQTHLHHALLV